MIYRLLPFAPAICLLVLFAYLDRLLRKVKPTKDYKPTLLRDCRVALWGSWACVLASAIVWSFMEGK